MYLGIDPGAGGAICSLRFTPAGKAIIFFHALPNSKVTIHDSMAFIKATQVDSIIYCGGRLTVAVEDVHSLPNMTAKSNFSFGYNLGTVHTMLESLGITFSTVQPKKWQKKTGIVFPKGTDPKNRKIITATQATTIYPDAQIYGPRGGLLDGRADALMIAHYLHLENTP